MLEPFLHEAKRRRLLNRVLFGSDQMGWPEAIALASIASTGWIS